MLIKTLGCWWTAIVALLPNSFASANDFKDILAKTDIFAVSEKSYATRVGHWRTNGVVSLLLHSASDSDKSFVKDHYSEISKQLRGLLFVGEVDCTENPTLCQKLGYKGDSTVAILPPLPAPHYNLNLEEAVTEIPKTPSFMSKKNVITITDEDNFKFFRQDRPALPKVLLLSKREQPAILYHALANSLHDRMIFGFVGPSSDPTSAIKKSLRVTEMPKLIVLREEKSAPEFFRGNVKNYLEMFEFLNIRSETFVKGGGFQEGLVSEKPWLDETFPEMTFLSVNDICKKKKSFCAILFTDSADKLSADEHNLLQKLTAKYSASGKFKFVWINGSKEINWSSAFKVNSLPEFVLLNQHKRLRFIKSPATYEDITETLDRFLNGDSRPRNLDPQKFPEFVNLVESDSQENRKEEKNEL
eukprot:GHVP01061423.1.p1 GENE.GHVP01061423.1~~GHVP01061423.1.p1  ORF type:complete len:416 (+),score=82.91 GHVP01061423.1:1568-2815(+)